jgi:hypothetical protein
MVPEPRGLDFKTFLRSFKNKKKKDPAADTEPTLRTNVRESFEYKYNALPVSISSD